MNFENLTISKIKKITEEYERLQKECKYFQTKYPNAEFREEPKENAQGIIDELEKKEDY